MTQLALRSFLTALQDPFPTELAQFTVGFDRLFDDIRTQFSASDVRWNAAYPPHNIRKLKENVYALDFAVAGFQKNNLEISVEKQILVIKGHKPEVKEEQQYLYRGLALRSFEKHIPLVETAEVRSASLEDGILTVTVENVIPEKEQKRLITITPTQA